MPPTGLQSPANHPGLADTGGGTGGATLVLAADQSWASRQFARAQFNVRLLDDYDHTSLFDANYNLSGAQAPIKNDAANTLNGRFFSGGVLLSPSIPGGVGKVQLGTTLNGTAIAFPTLEPWAAAVRVYMEPFTGSYVNYLSMQAASANDSIQIWSNSVVSADTLQLSLWKGAVETRIALTGVGQINQGTLAWETWCDLQLRFDPLAAELRVFCNDVLAATITNFVTMPSVPLFLQSDSSGQQYLIDALFLAWKVPTT